MSDPTMQLLVRAKKGDRNARDVLTENNLGLVWHIVKHFMNRGYDAQDLFQIGCIGLLKAIDQFDVNRDVRFSTYAVYLISGEIKCFLRDDGMVKVSRSVKENSGKIQRARFAYVQEHGCEPTVSQLQGVTGLSAEEIAMADRMSCAVDSLEQNAESGDEKTAYTDDDKDELIDRLWLSEILRRLEPEERQLIYMRYYEERTQSAVAKMWGTTQVQISRKEKRIVQKIRKLARE